MVEQLTLDPKFDDSNTATPMYLEKIVLVEKSESTQQADGAQLVEPLSLDPKFEGSNTEPLLASEENTLRRKKSESTE